MKTFLRSTLAGLLAALLFACGGDTHPADTVPAPPSSPEPGLSAWTDLGARNRTSRPDHVAARAGRGDWFAYDRPPVYSGSIATDNIGLTMDDGVLISLNLVRPADANGQPADEPLPTIVTFTPYNKNIGGPNISDSESDYFVPRGYNRVIVDARGTGRSGGTWDPFSAREQMDYPQVLDWVVEQAWSDGVVGLHGISAPATMALLAAASGHPSVRAVFPIVPQGDIYRDVAVVGGQPSIAFLPAWMAVVTALATVNPTFHDQPEQYASAVMETLLGAGDFQIRRTLEALLQTESTAYDQDYWGTKSPLEFSASIRAPTFIVGGLFDIFQRSLPLNYEALKGHATAKLLMGPWHHLQAAVGEGLAEAGMPTLDQLALLWFDHYLKAMDNGAERLPAVTQWVWGHEQYVAAADWPPPDARARRLYLHGNGGLEDAPPPAQASPTHVLQQPFNGVCSASSLKVSLGLLGYAPLPCWYEDNLAQVLEATFDTAPLEEDLYINGPIQADLWISTTALNAGVVVRVSDLQPDGRARALSSGLLTASLRAVDESRARYLDGEMIQPWHPFTPESEQPVGSGRLVKLRVEVFQTSALIRRGHRLRISVGASDFPFGMMPLPNLLQSAAGVLSIHSDSEHASSVVLPVVPASALDDGE